MKTRFSVISLCVLFLASCQFPTTAPTPVETALPAPVEILATPISQSEIAIRWSPITDATSYEVYRDGNKVTEVEQLAFVDNHLNCGTTYHYSVKSTNRVGTSANSVLVSATTDQCTPGTPSGVSASLIGQTGASVSWTRTPPYSETGFRIGWTQWYTYAVPVSDLLFPVYANVDANTTSGTVNGVLYGNSTTLYTGFAFVQSYVTTNGRTYWSQVAYGSEITIEKKK